MDVSKARTLASVFVGHHDSSGRQTQGAHVPLLPLAARTAGQHVSEAWDLRGLSAARGTLRVTGASGGSPSVSASLQTSPDGNVWSAVGSAFSTASGAGMGAVASTGTTPPTLTLGGSPSRPIALRVRCVTAGARGAFAVQFSGDDGLTWGPTVIPPDDSSTPAIVDAEGDTGLTYTFADAAAATNNVWTATSLGWQVRLGPLDRYLRAVANVTDTVTFSLLAEVW